MHDSARTDLWEPWGSNPPGRPGPLVSVMPCLTPLNRDRSLPSSVRGPVLF